MTTIKASCFGCGSVELNHVDLTLMVCSDASMSYYTFVCPSCSETVRKPADDNIINLLISGGVPAIVWDIPAEFKEVKIGAPLDYNDLLDFCLELGTWENE